ncbi:ABC transporter ATP-binding protein [Carboxylicivirga sp. A043]|uniref:ABC transporter ATP-binding protein n=1 Tax=Carboxylicivirga litoralis TaxID=2816963 RepID=UPI0021CAEC43|nr:ABC transporter ATP-binding protein [Carboxylicivirga sp. A043]MCU4155112.1 ABC transporter ATP-binding protein [Carboxylicivirga sp. A043]
MAALIDINNLTIGYTNSKQHKVVAQSLNAHLNEGEMTCLLGANGKGKSTLMKTICGFLKSMHGDILLNGKSTALMSEKELAKAIAVVLTDKISIPNATVFELVAYGRSPFTGLMGRLSDRDKTIVKTAIEQCGISHKIHSPLSALSDGERQKATIAKALAQDTDIIILDEPTAFLDLPARVEIMQLLRQLASAGKSILMSTHDLDLALQMADKLWLLNRDGVTSGSPEDLLLNNAFQSMFRGKGIEFDNKTGLFTVRYHHNQTIAVKGHGFEYVLLRRALMRKGIKPVKANHTDSVYISINKNEASVYKLMVDDICSFENSSVEATTKMILEVIQTYVNTTSNLMPYD